MAEIECFTPTAPMAIGRTAPIIRLSITHNSGFFGGSRHRRNIESKESLVIHC
jgi:hypothetical protein